MDVATITMPRDEARAKLREYRRGLHRRADEEWERAAVAYEAAAEGKPLIVLSQALASCPRDEFARPRLAIARADQRQIRYRRWSSENAEEFEIWNVHPRMRDRVMPVAFTGARPAMAPNRTFIDGYALIPIVPPDVRRRRDLSRHFILWDVERWSSGPISATPDRDPYLLERVADDLFAVVGEWDLTEIERAVMRDRARG